MISMPQILSSRSIEMLGEEEYEVERILERRVLKQGCLFFPGD
jgi:hypothetical protein